VPPLSCRCLLARATHKGPFQGVAPAGRRVTWVGINEYRVADGKIRETWQLADTLGLMRQIGAVPKAED
jgi:predicted ester cyclase